MIHRPFGRWPPSRVPARSRIRLAAASTERGTSYSPGCGRLPGPPRPFLLRPPADGCNHQSGRVATATPGGPAAPRGRGAAPPGRVEWRRQLWDPFRVVVADGPPLLDPLWPELRH